MATSVMKVEVETEACCVCGNASGELISPEEYDASAPPLSQPLRAVLARLAGGGGAPPAGRLCAACLQRAVDAHEFSSALRARAPPPLSDKIRALRTRLAELTQKIDVFIVVGGNATGAGGERAYTEDDIIMVERGALAGAAEPAHVRNARGDPVYQCSVCPVSFQLSSEYRQHAQSHPPDAVHSCWTCGAQFPARAALHDHVSAEHAPTLTTCYICNTNFQNESELQRHLARCQPVCPLCNAVHMTRSALSAHAVALHSAPRGGQPALCPVCFCPQRSAAALTAHRLLHQQQRHYVCGYNDCVLRFPNRNNLLAHIRKCHAAADQPAAAAGHGQHVCAHAHCQRTFGSAAARRRHEKGHHTEQSDQEVLMETSGEVAAEGDVEGEVAQLEEGQYMEGEGEVEYLEVETLEEVDGE